MSANDLAAKGRTLAEIYDMQTAANDLLLACTTVKRLKCSICTVEVESDNPAPMLAGHEWRRQGWTCIRAGLNLTVFCPDCNLF